MGTVKTVKPKSTFEETERQAAVKARDTADPSPSGDRPKSNDDIVRGVLARFEEPFSLDMDGGNVWRVQGKLVIRHSCLERIATKARIAFKPPTMVLAHPDQAVILVEGYMPVGDGGGGGRVEWSIGEAKVIRLQEQQGKIVIEFSGDLPVAGNYRVKGNSAAYPYAMAEKRAKDRVILKLINLSGILYSEDEADDFREPASSRGEEHKRGTTVEEREAGRQRVEEAGGKGAKEYLDEDRRDDRTAKELDEAAKRDAELRAALGEPAADEGDSVVEQMKSWIDDDGQTVAKGKGGSTTQRVSDFMLSEKTQAALAKLTPEQKRKVQDAARARLVALGWGAPKK